MKLTIPNPTDRTMVMTMGHTEGRDYNLKAKWIWKGMELAPSSLCLSSSLRLVTGGYVKDNL